MRPIVHLPTDVIGAHRLLYQSMLGIVLAVSAACATAIAQSPSISEKSDSTSVDTTKKGILDLDIEQLAATPVVVPSMDIPVTSVTKEASTVGRSPAAIFVITQDMIRRSGVTCIPEALRMAPGLEVARIDSNKWAITCRGFNSRIANKLLVLMDGRTLYNPVTSGIIWDLQDYLMEDIDRIEVIRGPGGTLWGANAVNGVINIITKNAKDSQGSYATVGGGTFEREFGAFRYGGTIGDDCSYRIYGKYFDRGPGYLPNEIPDDAWQQGRVGFRADWTPGVDKADFITVQGDHYLGNSGTTDTMAIPAPPYGQVVSGNIWNTGQNVLTRWRHVYDDDSDWTLQTYYDDFSLNDPVLFASVKTFDIDFQYRFPLGDRHSITCGAAFRSAAICINSHDTFAINFIPSSITLNTPSQFVQDEITLSEDLLTMTLGCKLEQCPFTYNEYQPSIRMLYTPDRRHTFWGAVSRAVRTPSVIDENMALTLPTSYYGVLIPRIYGSHAMQSEALMAYELGYRTQATDAFSWDIATFYNVYDELRAVQIGMPFLELNPLPPHMIIPLTFNNRGNGAAYGAELSANWSITERWRLQGQYTYLQLSTHYPAVSFNTGNDPHNQIYCRSSWDIRDDLQYDLIVRWVDRLPGPNIPAYVTMDMRLGWTPSKHWELAVVGQNLLQAHHYEFGPTTDAYNSPPTEVPRGVYGSVTWRH